MKTKILLVNPHIEDFSAYDHHCKPLGLFLLASYLRPHAELAYVNALQRDHPRLARLKTKADGTGDFHKQKVSKPSSLNDIPRYFRRYGLPDDLFLEELKSLPFEPDWIFVGSGMTYWFSGLRHSIRLLRESYPETPIVIGGISANLITNYLIENSGADYVVTGQAPLKVLSQLAELLQLPALLSQEQSLLTPDYSLMRDRHYAPVISSLGCPFHCSYCASNLLCDYRIFPPEQSAEMILELRRRYGIQNFAFYDDALLAYPERNILPLLRILRSGDFEGRFYTPNGLHITYLSAELARLLKATGFEEIRLSLESVNTEFHDKHDGKTDKDEFRHKIGLLLQAGFSRRQLQVYILANLPGENLDGLRQSFDSVLRAGATPRLAFYSPIPGTKDFARAEAITDLSNPLSHNNTVFLYRSGIDLNFIRELQLAEKEARR